MYGGTRSYEMGRRLVAWGHEVHVVTSDRSGSQSGILPDWYQTEEAGIQVHWLPVPYSNKMGFKDRIKAFAKFALMASHKAASLKGDVIFATSTPLTIAIPGIYASKRCDIPMVFEVRDLWPELPIAIGALRNKGLIASAKKLESQAYKHSAQVVALSPGMREGVQKAGYPAGRIHVIPNSCDLDLFSVPEAEGQRFRHSHEWLGNRPLVIYAGTLGKINGVSYLVRVAAETIKKAPEVRFLIAGRGAEEQKIKGLARDLGVLDKNLFMPGTMPKKEIPAVFSAADITTSLFIDLKEMWANSANKFFDGLASGTPIAINYSGWQKDILEEYQAGLTLPPHDYAQASGLLIQHLSDDKWLKQAGNNARRLARQKYNRDLLAKKLERVLTMAVENPSRTATKSTVEVGYPV
jgi:glycosyltransferase involved in cell wall biosynthesis